MQNRTAKIISASEKKLRSQVNPLTKDFTVPEQLPGLWKIALTERPVYHILL